jgi:ribosome-binding factor A
VHDPDLEGHIITVPEVRMSPDLKLATVYVMPLGGATTETVLAALERNKKFLRGEIAHRVNLKFAPDIRFRVDERFDEAERIEKLLRTPAVQRDLGFGRRTDGRPDRRSRRTNHESTRATKPSRGAKKIIFRIPRASARQQRSAHTQKAASAAQQPAAPRQARRPRLGRARQAVGMTSTHAVAVVKRLFTPSAPATPARSIRSPPAACRSRSARPPRPCRS